MPLLTSLLLLIVLSRLLGELFKRMKQPSLLGEIAAGIILGPTLLGIIKPNEALSAISELAVFLIVLSAGLEMDFKEVINSFKGKGLFIATLAFGLPLVSGVGIGVIYDLDVMRTVFLGLCIAITALPVAIRILGDFGMLKTDISRYAISTAIINDVIALLALAVILDLPAEKTFDRATISIFFAIIKLVGFGALVWMVNYILESLLEKGVKIDWFSDKLVQFFGKEALFGLLIVFVLVFSSISELLGSHFVIGAFFGALLINRKLFFKNHYADFEGSLNAVSGGFLSPIFFAYIGLAFNLSEVKEISFVLSVIVASVFSKVIAGWVGGKLAGMPSREALGLGIILNGRGIMELVVANIALSKGFIGPGLFSTLVIMGLFTTLITPIFFRYFLVKKI